MFFGGVCWLDWLCRVAELQAEEVIKVSYSLNFWIFLRLQIVHEQILIFPNAFVTQSYLLTQETETTEMLAGAYPS